MRRLLAILLTLTLVTQPLLPSVSAAGLGGRGLNGEVTLASSPAADAESEPPDDELPSTLPTEIVLVPNGPATMQVDGQPAQVSAGELIVCYQDGSANRPTGMLGMQSHSNDAGVSLVEVPAAMDLESAMKTLQDDPNVAYVEPNYLVWAAAAEPNDPLFGSQWALPAIKAPAAWSQHDFAGLPPITVAVVDTGVDKTHADLINRLLPGYNFARYMADGTPYASTTAYNDDAGHGTKVSGIIAAEHNNSIGISGVAGAAPVKLLPIKVLNDAAYGTVFDLANGIRYAADQGAKVINLSLTAEGNSQTLANAIRYAQDKGAVVVAAIGDDWRRVYPGAYPGVITVGSLDKNLEKPYTWSGEAHLDLVAPGVGIQTTNSNSSYASITGTSAAAAHVSGAAALYLLLNPSATASDVANTLNATATDMTGDGYDDEGWDSRTGWGLLNVQNLLGTPQSVTPVINFVSPQPDTTQIGAIELELELIHGQDVNGVAFYLDSMATPAFAQVTKTDGQSFLSYTWDTATTDDGEHTIYAQAYGDAGPLGEPAELQLFVKNEADKGLIMQVLAPNGAIPNDAKFSLYRRMSEAEDGYDPLSPYKEVKASKIYAGGLIEIPGTLALDLHTYTIVIQGTFDTETEWANFTYVRQLEGPIAEVIDGSSTVPVSFSLIGASEQPLPCTSFILRLKDDEGSRVTTMLIKPSLESAQLLYLDEGIYDTYAAWSPSEAEEYIYPLPPELADQPAYFIRQENLSITADTSEVAFTAENTGHMISRVFYDYGEEASSAGIGIYLGGEDIEDVVGGDGWSLAFPDELVLSPGQYDIYSSVSVSRWDYYFSRKGFIVSPGIVECNFGGQFAFNGEVLNSPVAEGKSLEMSFNLTDHYGNTITSIYEPSGSYSRRLLDVSMLTYSSLDDAYPTQSGNPDQWYVNQISKPTGRATGDWFAALRLKKGSLSTSGSDYIYTPKLPFTVVPKGSDPGTGGTKTVPVYDRDDQPAANLEYISLYTLTADEDGAEHWGWTKGFAADSEGKIHIPNDSPLSMAGNAVIFAGEYNGVAMLYAQSFSTLDELQEIRLRDCSIQLQLNPLNGDSYPNAVLYLPQNGGNGFQVVGGARASALFVTPGNYSFYAFVYDEPSNEPCLWLKPITYIGESQTITLETDNPARLTVNAADGYEFFDGGSYERRDAVVITPISGVDQGRFFPPETPAIRLSPGGYHAQAWVSRPDAGNDPDQYKGYRWVYGISLSDTDEELLELTAGEAASFIVGGPFTVDFRLDEVNLTTSDLLTGEVFIKDNQGNRLFAVAIQEFYSGGAQAYLSDHMQVNAAGQIIIPQPEVLAQSARWPFVYPFLRLYKVNEDATEVRVFNKCADNYFYDFELPLDSLEPGNYRLELAISMGDGILTTSKGFSLNPSSAAALDKLPAVTNQPTFTISGSAGPNAEVTVFYRLGASGEPVQAGTTTADGIGRFSLNFTFPVDAIDGEYFFAARAKIDGVETPESKAVRVLLDRVAPAPPSGFAGEPQDSTHVLLSWQASPAADVKSYLVRRNDALLVELALDKLTHLDGGLIPATTYEYALVAVDYAGNESEALVVSVYTGVGEDKVPPATPAMPVATYKGGGEAIITWQPTTDNIGVTSYKLFQLIGGAESELCKLDVADPSSTPELTFTHTGLLNETTYKYGVRAYDAAGNGSDLSPVCALATPQIQIYSLTYRFPGESGRADLGLIYPGAVFTLRMLGEKGRTATAEVSYEASSGENEEKTLVAELRENETIPGTYTGEFTLPNDAARLKLIRGVLTDGSHPVSRETNVSLQTTADLKVVLPEAALNELKGLGITVWSASRRAGQTAVVQVGVQEYFFEHLTPGNDYKLTIKGPLNRTLAEASDVKVAAGMANSVTLVPKLQAELTVRVTDDKDEPLAGVSVFARNSFTRLATTAITDANGLAPLTLNMLQDEDIQLEIAPTGDLLSLPYVDYVKTTHKALAGSHTVNLTLASLPMGTISGTVTLDEIGEPVIPGVTINAVYTRNGRSIPATTVTDADGSYTLYLPEGTNVLTASTPTGHILPSGQQVVSVKSSSQTKQDLKLSLRAWSTIDVQLETKYIDRPPLIVEGMDWWSAVHFSLQGHDSSGRRYSGIPLRMRLEPNENITITVDGKQAGLPKAEQTIKVDENRQGKVIVKLEEFGRIVGRLVDERGNDFPLGPDSLAWSVQLLEITSPGRTSRVHAVNLDDAAFQISVPQPGNYELFISRPSSYVGQTLIKYPTATVGPISVGMYDIKDVGNVNLAWDKTDAKAYFTVNNGEAAAGGVVNCAVRIGRNSYSTKPMEAARVTVKLPVGCELVEGSVSFEGQIITPLSTSPSLIVDLGDLELNGTEEKVLNFSLRLSDPLPDTERVLLSGHFRWQEGGKELTVNPVPIEIMLARVTLNAPDLVVADNRQTGVHGRGPVGAEVSVYDGADLLGIATVSPGGYWQLQVTLADRGYPVQHELQAVTMHKGEMLQSEIVQVMYNPKEPVITSVTFRQGNNGRVVTFNPSEGVARFPYVVRPGEGPFVIDVRFNKPNLVNNVWVGVGAFSVKTESTSGSGQQYRASVKWDGTKFGSIWVEYDTKHDPNDVRQEKLTEEQLRHQTPPGMRDYRAEVDKELDDNWRPDDLPADWPAESKSAAINVSFGSRPDMAGRVEISLAADPNFQPTAEDMKKAQETGIPVYGLKVVGPIITEDKVTMWVEGYVAADYISASMRRMSSSFSPASWASYYRQLTKLDVTLLEAPIDGYGAGKDTMDLLTASSMFDKYSELLDQADNCGAHSSVYGDAIKRAADRKMAAEGVKWGMKLAGCILAPVSFGWGTVALFAASELMEWAINDSVEGELQHIKNEMDADPSCRGEDEWWHELADEIRRKKVAEPTWIWDPSGIVYEGVMNNPIEGVKATAYEVNQGTGELAFWDADWYGQQNPLYTDGIGYYGWDVPEGQWQVTYEKDGYAPAQSAVLPVPPPQTEVHINLVNLAAPNVVAAAAAAEGKYLQVTFDQYMLADILGNDTVWVTYQGEAGAEDEGLQYVKGTVEAHNAVAKSDNPALLITRQLRFVPETALAVGREYQLTIDGIVQNYGGIPMGGLYNVSLTIPEKDPTVPEIGNLQVVPDHNWVDLTWTDPAGDGLQVEIIWKDSVRGEEVGRKIVSQGVESYQIPHLFSGSKYTVTVRVIDCLGNKSAGVEKQVQTKVVDLPKVPDKPPVKPDPPVYPDPPSDPGGPSQPVILGEVTNAAVKANDGSITLTWTDPTATTLKEIKVVWLVKGTDAILGQEIVKKGTQTFTIDGLTNGTEYEVRIHTIDRLGKESAGLVLSAIPHPVDTAMWQLSGEQQMLAAFDDGLRISIPAGAFAAGTEMTAQNLGKPSQPTDKTLSAMGDAYSCATDAEAAAKPLFLALQYDAERLGTTDARQLGIYRQDEKQPGQWIYVGGTVDLFNRRLTTEVSQLGTFAVMLRRPVFIDLKGHWGKLDVEIMAARGLAAGVGGGKFDPDRPITRAELVTFIMRLVAYSGKELPAATGEEKVTFTDLAPGAWYGGMVRTAARLGLLQSTMGRFRPNDGATREEMADMLVRVLELLGQPSSDNVPTPPFKDLKQASSWATESIAKAWYKGIMGGVGGGLFSPQGTSTRAQVAAVMVRVLDRLGLLTAIAMERGTLRVGEDGQHYELVNCAGSDTDYRLTAVSEEVKRQLEDLMGQFVRVTGLRVQSSNQSQAAPQLRVLSVTKSAEG